MAFTLSVRGRVEVERDDRSPPWRLTEAAKLRLGLDRSDKRVRLHFCLLCGHSFVADFTASKCPNCLRRPAESPRPISRAAQHRAALARATCGVCDAPIAAKRLTARFCSGRCRQAHHRRPRA